MISDQRGWHPEEKEHKTTERTYWRKQNIINDIGLIFSIGAFTGRVCYLDIFKKEHYTDFCIMWHWVNNALGGTEFCKTGNQGHTEED
jgi:hypothetical protein